MVVHAADERSQHPEHALNLRCSSELEAAVDVRAVPDWPSVLDTPIDRCAIGVQTAPRLHVALEEPCRVVPLHRGMGEDKRRDFPRPRLLPHDERPPTSIRLVELHQTL